MTPSTGPAASPPAASRTTSRTLDLLEFVLAEGETNLTSAAAAVALTPTTALRHLKSLEARGYVHRDPLGLFSAGPTFLRLAAAALRDGPHAHLIALSRPHLAALAGATGESAYLAIRDGAKATYLATIESTRAIRHTGWLGRQVPIRGTAIGEALTGETGIRVRTGAVEPDITAVAVSVRGGDQIIGALSVVGPTHRMTDEQIRIAGRELADAGSALAAELGPASKEAS